MYLYTLLVLQEKICTHVVIVLAFQKFLAEPNIEAGIIGFLHVVAFFAHAVHSRSCMISSMMVKTTTNCSTLKMM